MKKRNVTASAAGLILLAVVTLSTVPSWSTFTATVSNSDNAVSSANYCSATTPTPGTVSTTGGTRVALTIPTNQTGVKHVYLSASDTAAAVTSAGTVYTWGDNTDGALGQGTTVANTYTPSKMSFPSGVEIAQVALGYHFGVALTTTGDVYTWGDNTNGALGNGTFSDSNVPGKITLPNNAKITQISASWSVIALASNGDVYTWGLNNYSQLGNGALSGNTNTPGKINFPDNPTITQVSMGSAYGGALDSNGDIYTWGSNGGFGRLGNGAHGGGRVVSPAKISVAGATPHFTKLSLSQNSSLAVSSTGDVYTWGSNGYGQNGFTSGNRYSPTLLSLPGNPIVSDGQAGINTMMVITADGKFYSWGANAKGQAGFPSPPDNLYGPRAAVIINNDLANTRVIDFSYMGYSALAATANGNIYSWGSNSDGQLGSTPPDSNQHGLTAVTSFDSGDYFSQVTVDGTEVTATFLKCTNLTILFTAPQHSAGTVAVVVTMTDSSGSPTTSSFSITYVAPS